MLPLGKRRRQAKGAARLSGSCTFRIGPQPLCVSSFVELARREGKNSLNNIFFARRKVEPIQLQEHDTCQETRSLISVNEWMIPDNTGSVEWRHLDDVNGLSVRVVLTWPGEGRFQKPAIT